MDWPTFPIDGSARWSTLWNQITHKSKYESKCNCKQIWNFIQVFHKWCLTYLPIFWVSRTLKAVMLPWLEIISKYFFFFNLPIISQMWKLFRYCLSKDAFSTECLKWIEYLKSTLGILFWKFWFTLTIQNKCVIWFVDIVSLLFLFFILRFWDRLLIFLQCCNASPWKKFWVLNKVNFFLEN